MLQSTKMFNTIVVLVTLAVVQFHHAVADAPKVVIFGADGAMLDTTVGRVVELLKTDTDAAPKVYNYFDSMLPSDPQHCALWDAVLDEHRVAAGLPIALHHERVLDCVVRRHDAVKVIFVKNSHNGAAARLNKTVMLTYKFWPFAKLLDFARTIPPFLPFVPTVDTKLAHQLVNSTTDAYWNSWASVVENRVDVLGKEVGFVLDPKGNSKHWKALEVFLLQKESSVAAGPPTLISDMESLANFYFMFAAGIATGFVKAYILFNILLKVLVRIPPVYRVITFGCQVWFAVLLVWVLSTTWVIAHIIHLIPGLPQRRKEELSMLVLHFCYVIFFNLQPWIRIRKAPGMDKYIDEMRQQEKGSGGVLFLNHTSFLDPMVMCYLLPWDLIMNTRTLAKEALFKIPLLGKVFTKVGHFPVYFKNDTDFSVDQDKQAKVSERVHQHITTGGTLTFCPEGIVNKDDPTVLKPFRRGSFLIAAENHLPMWGMVTIGNYKAWPPRAKIGGFPAVIDVDMMTFRSREEWSRLNAANGDGETSSGKRLKELQHAACEMCQEKMQEVVDEVYRRRHSRGIDWVAEGFMPRALQKED